MASFIRHALYLRRSNLINKLFIDNILYTWSSFESGVGETCDSLQTVSWDVGDLENSLDDDEFLNLVFDS